ncbi:hypothetical protein AsAng_0050630 [Aureispira anguillae]|uniref:Uncharacterized protein n=1 Tax=Aureispira anguillae TaxID=2864201 RepID=A0A915YJR7_9BACT|nr:hypothetical protein AsAng_0050630 [Aureispira anguillae]
MEIIFLYFFLTLSLFIPFQDLTVLFFIPLKQYYSYKDLFWYICQNLTGL